MTIQDFYSRYFKPGIISTDSRKIDAGTIFIALKGEQFNGNEFALSAIKSGASVAVVDEPVEGPEGKLVRVKNSLEFLQKLAAYHRQKCKFNIIGLTGSNGKTTTKELIHAVLSVRFKVHSTQGNLNNHIGVPMTILSFAADTEIGVVEMGANHPGEIKALCNISRPDSGLITNIGKAHLEGFNGFDGVVKAKSELFDFLKSDKGKIYFNRSDELLCKLVDDYKNTECYGSKDCTCSGEITESVPTLKIKLIAYGKEMYVETQLYGDYNLNNILAAACIGLDTGMPVEEIKKGIESYRPSNMRSQIIQIGNLTVIMDCYNANPSSMQGALHSMSNFASAKKVVILGGMKELGDESAAEHKKLGKLLESLDFEKIILFGPEFSGIILKNGFHTESFNELSAYVDSIDLKNRVILVKGSRSNKLERLEKVFHDRASG